MDMLIVFYLLLFFVAFLYTSVGQGGAYFGALRCRQEVLKHPLAFVLMMTSYKLLL
jgi:hypothetical protein